MTSSNPSQLRAQIEMELSFLQPKLSIKEKKESLVIEGGFVLSGKTVEGFEKGAIKEYPIRVIVDPRYPLIEPEVYETGKLIPHHEDYHINSQGKCCICVWETWVHAVEDNSLVTYFDGPIRNFFISQLIFSQTGEWPFGEWKHGFKGLIDAYSERLEVKNDKAQVLSFLKSHLKISKRDTLPSYWQCPCKSGLHIKNCCQSKVENIIQTIAPAEAQLMLDRVQFELRKRINK